jgi:YegS/Rv2252/BmrU family lipid kinase
VTKRAKPPEQAILIVNAKSRQGAEAFEAARDGLTRAGIELIEAKAIKDPRRIGGAVKKAIKAAPMVILGGGDGTLSANIDHFLGQDTAFAPLPLGTANSFARTIGLPLDIDEAVKAIAKGEVRDIDLACIDGDYFLNNAAIGLAPLVAESVPHGLKRNLGRLGYLLWAGWSAASFKAFRLVVDDGRKRHRLWATEVRIANGRYHGGIELIESADIESGDIVVQAVTGRSLVGLARSYAASVFKSPKRRASVREFRGKRLRLETRPPQRVSIDGELGPQTPIEVSVAPAAVKVVVPRRPNRQG